MIQNNNVKTLKDLEEYAPMEEVTLRRVFIDQWKDENGDDFACIYIHGTINGYPSWCWLHSDGHFTENTKIQGWKWNQNEFINVVGRFQKHENGNYNYILRPTNLTQSDEIYSVIVKAMLLHSD